jgi:hypothetical protein
MDLRYEPRCKDGRLVTGRRALVDDEMRAPVTLARRGIYNPKIKCRSLLAAAPKLMDKR